VVNFDVTFEALEQEWLNLTREAVSQQRWSDLDLVGRWERAFADLSGEVALHRDDWLGGPRTLLAAMRVQNLEVPLTAAVAWLLRPDGHHGLGSSFLDAFLARFGVEADSDKPVRIEVEETIGDTRADLVVRVAGSTLLVESKVHAAEQGEQLDRLAARWQHERPVLIFLTRTARDPVTAVASRGQWRQWLWSDIAADVRACLELGIPHSAGVEEFLQTLEIYHRTNGGPVSDAKTDFYLKHWRQIEEWAALRKDARRVLEEALRGLVARASDALVPGPIVVGEQLDSAAWPHISVLDPTWRERGSVVKVSVAWNRGQLLSSSGECWPSTQRRSTRSNCVTRSR